MIARHSGDQQQAIAESRQAYVSLRNSLLAVR
jgi:hypothetical protein